MKYFIQEIIPVAIECNVNMGLHPDDPPWPIFGIPRIITDEAAIDRFLSLYDDPHHGLSLCSGSLAAPPATISRIWFANTERWEEYILPI